MQLESCQYRYVLDMTRANGSTLGQFPANVDLEPVVEWGRFMALRSWPDPVLAVQADILVQPLWHVEAGAPYVGGLRVTARTDGERAISSEIPLACFKAAALRLGDALMSQKRLERGEVFTYAVLAFLDTRAGPKAGPGSFEIEEMPVPATVHAGSLAEELERSIPFGDTGSGLLPVFVPQSVIDEVLVLAEGAGNVEVGAVLIGNLHRDAVVQELFLKVTAQIPARHALSESAKLSLTPATWAAVEAAIALRGRSEQMAGWFHNHPAKFWCNQDCSPEAKLKCPFDSPFFSSADCDLHRTVFFKAHSVALLVTNAFTGMKLTLYGWDRARIVQRGFHISKPDAARPLLATEVASTIGDPHETPCHP